MNKHGSNIKVKPWVMAALFASLITGCGQDGIFGGPPGSGPGGVPGAANPGPAGTAPALGAAAPRAGAEPAGPGLAAAATGAPLPSLPKTAS